LYEISRRINQVKVLRRLIRLANDPSGATAVEYALIVGAIAGVIAVVVYVLGHKTNNLYNTVKSSIW
jgi:Flp pilus assembly pilin Flp